MFTGVCTHAQKVKAQSLENAINAGEDILSEHVNDLYISVKTRFLVIFINLAIHVILYIGWKF